MRIAVPSLRAFAETLAVSGLPAGDGGGRRIGGLAVGTELEGVRAWRMGWTREEVAAGRTASSGRADEGRRVGAKARGRDGARSGGGGGGRLGTARGGDQPSRQDEQRIEGIKIFYAERTVSMRACDTRLPGLAEPALEFELCACVHRLRARATHGLRHVPAIVCRGKRSVNDYLVEACPRSARSRAGRPMRRLVLAVELARPCGGGTGPAAGRRPRRRRRGSQ